MRASCSANRGLADGGVRGAVAVPTPSPASAALSAAVTVSPTLA